MSSKNETLNDPKPPPLAAARIANGDSPAAPAGLELTPRQALLGDINMRIDRAGVWHYLGSPIKRQALVRLFASVLKRDAAGDYWLVTPAEVARLDVEDTPFHIVAMELNGSGPDQSIIFRTNVDQNVALSGIRPLRIETAKDGAPKPLLVVADDGTEALLDRAIFYDLIDLGRIEDMDHQKVFGVWSAGDFFPLADADDEDLMREITDGLDA